MEALPLPPRPDLAQYRKRAKELVGAASSTEPDAVRVWAATGAGPRPLGGPAGLVLRAGELRSRVEWAQRTPTA